MEDGRDKAANAQRHDHVAELRDGGIGQHALDIVLGHGDGRGKEGREAADQADDHQRHGAFKPADREDRQHARDQVDARGDHGRRVDQRRDGRGAFHRVGQPDVQRELRTLAAGPEHQEQTDRRRHAAADIQAWIGQPRLPQDPVCGVRIMEIERAVRRPDQEQAERKPKIADPVNEKRLFAGRDRRWLLEPEADQQITTEPDRFPEHVQQHKIAHADEHRHREHEQRDICEEPHVAGIAVHIARRVDGDQRGDERDHAEHDRSERIGAEDDVDGERFLLAVQRFGVGHVGPGPERDDLFLAHAKVAGSRRLVFKAMQMQ